MRSRKGMSPLIATVLLIAFAVALGAMIMNWSVDGTTTTPDDRGGDAGDPCQDVQLQLKQVFGKQILCYQDGAIKFNVVNTGGREITGIQVRTIDEDLNEVKHDVPGSRLPSGGTFEYSLPAAALGRVHVELVPYVLENGNPKYCISRKIVNDALPSCSNE
ncbi:hypothetical protein JXA12_01105 [Candidatus Woesearchaeota archaeon]|nr:hypothetical protein [Candidatus Woesearchaeota archaeon]